MLKIRVIVEDVEEWAPGERKREVEIGVKEEKEGEEGSEGERERETLV